MTEQALPPQTSAPTPNPFHAPPTFGTLTRSSGDADTRVQVIEGAIATFRRYAFHDATIDIIAATSHLTAANVTQAFPTWESLVIATVDRWNGQRMRPILPLADRHGAVVFLRAIVQANINDPALMRLLSALANVAATPDHPMAPFLQEAWKNFHLMVMRQLTADITSGREPDTMHPGRGAEQLIALYEGLQLQFMVRPGMNLLDAFDRAVTRLRDGWANTYTPPIWNLDEHSAAPSPSEFATWKGTSSTT